MLRLFTSYRKKSGQAPGTPIHIGEKKLEKATISVMDFSPDHLEEHPLESVAAIRPYLEKDSTTWIDVSGVHDVNLLQEIGQQLDIHMLSLEDIANTTQRPKLDEYPHQIILILRMLYIPEGETRCQSEQVSLVLGKNYVLTFQEREGDVFDMLRKRLRSGNTKVRQKGADYLAYSVMDAIVDHYFLMLEDLGRHLSDLDDQVMTNPDETVLHRIHELKQEIIYIRKSIWPLRDVISRLQRLDSPLIGKKLSPYLHDIYDHTIQAADTVETFRDVLLGLTELYMSSVSNRMNKIMQVLTVIATIFIPLTFLAGVYGMNFDYMPELHMRYAYPTLWIIFALSSLTMLMYFHHKRWI